MDAARFFAGDTADVPIIGVAVFASDDVIFADFAGKGYGFFEAGRHGADEVEFFGKFFFVHEGAVGGHLHAGIDRDEISELSGEGGGKALDAIGEVENAAGVVHAAGEQARVGQETSVRGHESAAFVLLAARTFAREEIWPSALDAGAFDWLVDIEANVMAGGEFDRALVVAHAELGVVKLAAAVNHHHAAGIAGFDVVDVVVGVIIVGDFELFFVIINEADGFVMADQLDALLFGVVGDGVEIKIVGGDGEFVVDAVFEPVAFPAFVPALDEQAANAESDGGVDVFDGVGSGSAVPAAGRPCPLADVHSPPNADEFESLDPAKIVGGWVVQNVHDAVGGELDGGIGDHDETPRGFERQV